MFAKRFFGVSQFGIRKSGVIFHLVRKPSHGSIVLLLPNSKKGGIKTTSLERNAQSDAYSSLDNSYNGMPKDGYRHGKQKSLLFHSKHSEQNDINSIDSKNNVDFDGETPAMDHQDLKKKSKRSEEHQEGYISINQPQENSLDTLSLAMSDAPLQAGGGIINMSSIGGEDLVSFTLLDVERQLVLYRHDGSETLLDSMLLQLQLVAQTGYILPAYLQVRSFRIRFVLLGEVDIPRGQRVNE